MRTRVLTLRTSADAERQRDAERVRRRRAAGREIDIPRIGNPRRRRKCRENPALFMRRYFESIFYNPFSKTQREMIEAFQSAINTIGWRGIAFERGGGKTNIILGLAIYAICYGLRRFVVLIGANATEANRNASQITAKFEDPTAWPEFSADFPEITAPVQALQGAPQRARQMAYRGELVKMKWSREMIRFPTIPGSPSSGAILLSRGLDSAIRGTQYDGNRPDLILLDDPETAESAKSPQQTKDLADRVDRDICGMAGPNRSCAILYVGTVVHRNCLADQYTDPAKKPAWGGKRYPLLIQYPDRMDLWANYIEQYQRDTAWGDALFTKAHAMFLAKRRIMTAGAKVSSDSHYADDKEQRRPDGSPLEISTLQFCMNRIAAVGQEAFNTEYQQIPPAHEEPQTAAITRPDVVTAITNRPRGVLPEATDYLTAGIDINARLCHWVLLAGAGAASHVVDYGAMPVHSPSETDLRDPTAQEAVEQAVLTALLEIRDAFNQGWPLEESGEVRHLDTALVDAGYKDTSVYTFVKSGPRGLYRASKGFGSKSGQARYRHPVKTGHGRRIGTHWFATRQGGPRVWLYNIDADFWKERVQIGFMLPHDGEVRPGTTTLFGSDPATHTRFADHITAEIRTTVYRDGKWATFWDVRRQRNHWLDALALAAAAAAICGQPIITAAAKATAGGRAPSKDQQGPGAKPKKIKQPRVSMAERQAAKRAAM